MKGEVSVGRNTEAIRTTRTDTTVISKKPELMSGNERALFCVMYVKWAQLRQ